MTSVTDHVGSSINTVYTTKQTKPNTAQEKERGNYIEIIDDMNNVVTVKKDTEDKVLWQEFIF